MVLKKAADNGHTEVVQNTVTSRTPVVLLTPNIWEGQETYSNPDTKNVLLRS